MTSVAWLIGWALILEYTIGGSAVARGISPNLAIFFGGPDSLPFFLARAEIPGIDVVVDPCAAILVLDITGLLCVGIKESSFVQSITIIANVCVMLFVIIAGGYIGFKTGCVGFSVSSGYFPYGMNGVLAGSATIITNNSTQRHKFPNRENKLYNWKLVNVLILAIALCILRPQAMSHYLNGPAVESDLSPALLASVHSFTRRCQV